MAFASRFAGGNTAVSWSIKPSCCSCAGLLWWKHVETTSGLAKRCSSSSRCASTSDRWVEGHPGFGSPGAGPKGSKIRVIFHPLTEISIRAMGCDWTSACLPVLRVCLQQLLHALCSLLLLGADLLLALVPQPHSTNIRHCITLSVQRCKTPQDRKFYLHGSSQIHSTVCKPLLQRPGKSRLWNQTLETPEHAQHFNQQQRQQRNIFSSSLQQTTHRLHQETGWLVALGHEPARARTR